MKNLFSNILKAGIIKSDRRNMINRWIAIG